MRYLLYSHDGVGLGHVRRHLAIAAALVEISPKARILLTTSVDEVSRLGLPPRVDTLKLPGLHKVTNGHYSARRLGLPATEICALRSALLLEAVRSFKPAVVVADKHPFGARGELRAALEAAKQAGARTALGLRDILDHSEAVLDEWEPDGLPSGIADYYDEVLIYGSPAVFDAVHHYRFPKRVAKRTRYCGYVVNRSKNEWESDHCSNLVKADPNCHPAVLGTTGGGEDGFNIMKTFIRAAEGASWKGVAVAGPLLGQGQLRGLREQAHQCKVDLHKFVGCLSEAFLSAEALVCMGGYNTLAEAVSQGIPTLCIPRCAPRAEQLMRARAFEKLGLVRCLPPEELSVERLRCEIGELLEMPREKLFAKAHLELDFDGAHRAASHLSGLKEGVRRTKGGRLEPVLA